MELTAPTMGKPKIKKTMIVLDDFTMDEKTGEVTACPAGEVPYEIQKGKDDGLKLYFDPEICDACDHLDYCSVGKNKERKLEYTPKKLRLAKRCVFRPKSAGDSGRSRPLIPVESGH